MLRLLLVLTILVMPLSASAEPLLLKGVWAGTVGTKAIVACFNGRSPAESSGSYYYLSYLEPISLSRQGEKQYWYESAGAGRWELAAPLSGTMVGSWSNEKTNKNFPIRLSLVDGGDDESACARDSYNSRLESMPKIEKGKIVQFSAGRSYRVLRFAGQQTVDLFGPDSALGRINSRLRIDQSKEAVDSYFLQRREFLGSEGYPAVDEQQTKPVYWDSNFVTIWFQLSRAGEGRSGISNSYVTWNVRTGEEVDLWRWIGASSNNPKLPPLLKKFLYQKIKVSAECKGPYRGEGDYVLMLDKTGMHIDEEAWGEGCEKSFFVPYNKLAPFLSPAGKLAVSSILDRQ